MPARPKSNSNISEDELEDDSMQETSDEEDESDDDESNDDDSDDEDSEDNEDLSLQWQGEDDEEDSEGEEESADEEDNDSEDESDEDGNNTKFTVDSEEESGDESDDEDGSSDDSDDSEDFNEFQSGKFAKSKTGEMKDLKKQKQIKENKPLISKQEKQTQKKAGMESAIKTEKIVTSKPEQAQGLQKPQPTESKEPDTKTKVPLQETKESIKEKYAKKAGKALYVRFSKRLPTDLGELEKYVKGLCSRVISVRRPRQPAARFCLTDFDSKEDCKKAMKELQRLIVDGKKLHVEIPKTDSASFIDELYNRRRKKLKELRAKKKLQKSLKVSKEKVFTTAITVRNIPVSASVEEVKSHFPNAVEFKLFYAKKPQETNWAVVTLPTTKDATKAKQKRISIGEHKLSLSFVGQEKKKRNEEDKKQSSSISSKIAEEGGNGKTLRPSTGENQKKNEKRKMSGGEKREIPSKKIKRDNGESSGKANISNSPKQAKFQKSVKSLSTHQTAEKQQGGKNKQIKREKPANNGQPAISPIKNENNSFEKNNKQTHQNKGPRQIKSEKNVKKEIIGNKFNKAKMQSNHKQIKGEFPKGKQFPKKGKFHKKAMRP